MNDEFRAEDVLSGRRIGDSIMQALFEQVRSNFAEFRQDLRDHNTAVNIKFEAVSDELKSIHLSISTRNEEDTKTRENHENRIKTLEDEVKEQAIQITNIRTQTASIPMLVQSHEVQARIRYDLWLKLLGTLILLLSGYFMYKLTGFH